QSTLHKFSSLSQHILSVQVYPHDLYLLNQFPPHHAHHPTQVNPSYLPELPPSPHSTSQSNSPCSSAQEEVVQSESVFHSTSPDKYQCRLPPVLPSRPRPPQQPLYPDLTIRGYMQKGIPGNICVNISKVC